VANSSFLELYDKGGAVLQTGGFVRGDTNPTGRVVYQGYTEWDGSFDDTLNTVVEVRFKHLPDAPSFTDVRYNFYVKAQIDIYKGDYDPENETQRNVTQVASINSIYPVDIYIQAGNEEIEPHWIRTNWP